MSPLILVLVGILVIEAFFMLGLRTDVVHRDNFKDAMHEGYLLTRGSLTKTYVLESANMHPSENEKILASNDARMKGYKRVETIRKDMTYLLVYEKE